MARLKEHLIILLLLIAAGLSVKCVKDDAFHPPNVLCAESNLPTVSFEEVAGLYVDKTVQIQNEWYMEGYVASSDQQGNLYGVLYVQDQHINPTMGFEVEIDLTDSYLFYPVGQKVRILLKGLYLGKSNNIYKLGGVFSAFGNISVGRLPRNTVFEHLLPLCNQQEKIIPLETTITQLKDSLINTLIKVNNVQLVDEEVGLEFAVLKEETQRHLVDCDDNEVVLLNSGYSDFQAELLPDGNGSVTGILTKKGGNFQVVIRGLADMEFVGNKCPEIIDEFTSDKIFISELADPDNNAGARFVELYNAGNTDFSLKGWQLVRYTNANTDISSSIDLSNFVIGKNSTLVISPNQSVFETVYAFLPDLGVGTNSPADSNGDDNLQLLDPFGTVVDTFGRVGEDGSNTNHEFEDGRAVRKMEITKANPSYDFSEWVIYNDSGAAGTLNQPQLAPQDFSPGQR